MNVSVILAHPNVESFNHAIANTAVKRLEEKGCTVFYLDLYREGFDPVLPLDEVSKDSTIDKEIKRYCSELILSDLIIIIHPNWWGQPPAILKGWIDRVIRPGIAYEFQEGDSGEGVPIGLLKASHAIVFNTSNTPEVREKNIFGDPLERLWKDCIFNFCGVGKFYRKMFGVVVTSTPKIREDWLEEVKLTIDRVIAEHDR